MPSRHIAWPPVPFSAQHCFCSAPTGSYSPIPSSKGRKRLLAKRSVLYRRHIGRFGGVQDLNARSSHAWHPVLSEQDPIHRTKAPKESRGSGHDPGAQFLDTHQHMGQCSLVAVLASLPGPLPRDDEQGLMGTVVGQWHHPMDVPQCRLDGDLPILGSTTVARNFTCLLSAKQSPEMNHTNK